MLISGIFLAGQTKVNEWLLIFLVLEERFLKLFFNVMNKKKFIFYNNISVKIFV